jgi:tRNA G10  N-methylase Trm11
MRIDRVNPQTEFWYIIRREKVGFFAQLLEKRKVTEKELNQGELRPEFAYLMCCCANIKSSSVICDPFCGFGAIPNQLASSYKASRIFASDIDAKKILDLKKTPLSKCSNVIIQTSDATDITYLHDESVDAVITDPPWGIYEKIEDITAFYTKALTEIARVLKLNGTLICLSAKKEEFKKACMNTNFEIVTQIDTLVNGKKAAVFVCTK